MTDLRGGGFGSIGFGPFNSGQWGGDARYLIGDDGSAVAATAKYSAEVAWANGTISDDTYLAALRKYLGTTEEGSRERIAAENELSDAIYSIDRNKLVRRVNQASTANARVAALRTLIGFERRKLGTMTKDNEQRRELADRIADAQGQIRTVRWNEMVRRFGQDRLGIPAMLAFARQAAAGSRGDPDHEQWVDQVREWETRAKDAELARMYQDWEHRRIDGSAIVDHLKGRLAGMSRRSPQYAETLRTIEDVQRRIQTEKWGEQDEAMTRRVQNGTVSESEYLRYLKQRIDRYSPGSADRRSAKDTLLQATFQYGEARLQRNIEAGTADNQDLIAFYRANMTTMNPGSSRFFQLQQRISDLQLAGTETLAIWSRLDNPLMPGGGSRGPGGGGLGGHWTVDLSGMPGGTPVNADGFASQFDGSAFASNNCGMASTAMAVWAFTGGKIRVSGGDLRYYSGDRNQPGDEAGTTFGDISIALEALGLGLRAHHDMTFEKWRRRLASGDGSLINGHYSSVPANLRLTNRSDFTHTMYVDHAKKIDGRWAFFVMDPLGRAGYQGRYWPEEAIRAFGWSGIANNGGRWMGDVAFVSRGRSGERFHRTTGQPPFQAFDTDANGHSTVGRGGGTSREEAGRRRDWSKGQANDPTKPRFTGTRDGPVQGEGARYRATDEEIDDFLAAVRSTEGPGGDRLLDPTTWGVRSPTGRDGDDAMQRAMALEVLQRNGGDARLAGIEWFTGVKPSTDTGTWGATERFYANAVGPRLGYQPIPRTGIGDIDPMTPPAPLDLSTMGSRPTFVGPGIPGPQEGARIDGIAPELSDMSRLLLEELGVPVTPDMIRAVATWISAESPKVDGDFSVVGNNPFVLRTNGQAALPGQVGRGATGEAIFGSLEDGIRAAADQIKGRFPQISAGLATGDPERALVAIDMSGWYPYGTNGALVQMWNQMPGYEDRKIIGGAPRILNASGDLADLARRVPALGELFDVDPRDPRQMRWLQQNVEAAKAAHDSGASEWSFTTPHGVEIKLDFDPSMAGDLLAAKMTYLDWGMRQQLSPTERDEWEDRAKAAHREHDAYRAEVAVDEWQSHMDTLEHAKQTALGKGDWGRAYQITLDMQDVTKVLLGIPPEAPLDIGASTRASLLSDQDRGLVSTAIDRLEVRSAQNPQGDQLQQAIDNGYLHIDYDRQGNISGARFDVNTAYPRWVTDEHGDAKIELRTRDTHPDDFEDAPIPVVRDGVESIVPAYVQGTIAIAINGGVAYAPKEQGSVRLKVFEPTTRTTQAPASQPAYPGAPTFLPGRSGAPADPLGGFGSSIGGVFDQAGPTRSGTLFGGGPHAIARAGGTISSATRDDMVLRQLPGVASIPVTQVKVRDNRTGNDMVFVLSPDGSGVVMGYDQEVARGPDAEPFVVLDPGAGVVVQNGRLMVNGEEWDGDPAKIAGRVKWYGTDDSHFATGDDPLSRGANGYRHRVRQLMPLPGGGSIIDASPADPGQAYLEGDITLDELTGMTILSGGGRTGQRVRDVTSERLRRPPDGTAAGASDTERDRSFEMPTTALGARPWDRADQERSALRALGLPDDLAMVAERGPVNAGLGAGRRSSGSFGPPRAQTLGTGLASLGARLATSVRTAAEGTAALAAQQRQTAALLSQWQARRAADARAEAAARAARKASIVTVPTPDTGTLGPVMPRRPQGPRDMPVPRADPRTTGITPIAPAPKPKPDPALVDRGRDSPTTRGMY